MQRQVRTIIIFLSSLLYVISAENLSANDCSSLGQCVRTVNCKPAVQQIKIKGHHNLTLCKTDDPKEYVCCPSTESKRGVKSREACQQWKKSAPTAFSQTNENAKNREFPHIAAVGFYDEIRRAYYFRCVGSIISQQYILTTASCIINFYDGKVNFVRIGTAEVPDYLERLDPAVDYNIEKIKVHEQFNRRLSSRLNNIGLIKLEKTLSWTDFIRPACLYLKSDDPARLYNIGCNTLDFGTLKKKILQKNVVKPIALNECNVTYITKVRTTLNDTNICATSVKMDACLRDFEIPLQGNLEVEDSNSIISSIVGIAPYGIGWEGKYPDIYTRVYGYVEWIENIVWP